MRPKHEWNIQTFLKLERIKMSSIKRITKIEQQKKNKKRYNIYINHQYAFSVHEDLLVSQRLLKGKELDEEQIKELLFEEEENKAWQKALRYLNVKPRTEAEIKKYLQHSGFEEETISLIVPKLKERQFLNDQKYAEIYVEDRLKFKPRGKRLLEHELKRKGIKEQDIQKSIEDLDETKEYELAVQLIKKRLNQYLGLDWSTLQRRLGGYLMRKGFTYEVIYKVLEWYKREYIEDFADDS